MIPYSGEHFINIKLNFANFYPIYAIFQAEVSKI